MLRSSLFWLRALPALIFRRPACVGQVARSDCGVASVLTVLNLIGRPADPVATVDALDPDRAGTDLEALRDYVTATAGVTARALKAPADKVPRIRGELILHMSQNHYVVRLWSSRHGVLVFDPGMGPVFYPAADFAALFSGHLLMVPRKGPSGALPAKQGAAPGVVGQQGARGRAPKALFLLGVAQRLAEVGLLLCLCTVLFLVLNQASFPSLLMAFALIAACGGLLLLTRQTRAKGEEGLSRYRQSRLWQGALRVVLRGRDLSGFRGKTERDVAGAMRKATGTTIPARTQLPGILGAFLIMPLLLGLLSPFLSLAYVVAFLGVLTVVLLDGVQVCRRSVRGTIGRYSKLSHGRVLLTPVSAPDMIGEGTKWVVIGTAGLLALQGTVSPVALMFWILLAMQIVPVDFRRATVLGPALAARAPVSGLIGTEVHLRRQKVMAETRLEVTGDEGVTRIDGLQPLTMTLQQPDLTVREQRQILADIVRQTLDGLTADQRPPAGPVRLFGPGQDASQADYEYLMIARETRGNGMLPAPADLRAELLAGRKDAILRDLYSCAPGDFPVFWDVRGRLEPQAIRDRLRQAGVERAGHLTMTSLTVVEAA